MKKKGIHCCGFRYQHTYNGKLTEGRGNFVCISTILDFYFLCGWIGQSTRGTNRTTCTVYNIYIITLTNTVMMSQ